MVTGTGGRLALGPDPAGWVRAPGRPLSDRTGAVAALAPPDGLGGTVGKVPDPLAWYALA